MTRNFKGKKKEIQKGVGSSIIAHLNFQVLYGHLTSWK